MKILTFPFRSPYHFSAVLVVGWGLAWFAITKDSEPWVEIYVAFLATCLIVYALVAVLLPNEENLPEDGEGGVPGTKAAWLSWIYGCAPFWFVFIAILGFTGSALEAILLFLYIVPAAFLVAGYRWARMAIELKESYRWLYGQDPKEWEEARKRLGID